MGGSFRLEDVPAPEASPGSVVVRVEASILMSYLEAYVDGELPYYVTPGDPFTPVGNGVGIVEAVGRGVWHVQPGQRVLLSSLVVADERVADPAQLLIGVSAMDAVGVDLQTEWSHGTLAELALYPVSAVTPVIGHDDIAPAQLAAVVRCAIPYGGLRRGRLTGGETVIVVGASGSYGTAATLVALAMGAGRVVVAGRDATRLESLVLAGGDRVVAVTLSGDVEADAAALRVAARGSAQLAFDMVGQATDPHATLAALHALGRGGRLVLMGSMTTPLPIPYAYVMQHDLEIIGQFMYHKDACRELLQMVDAGLLNLGAIVPETYSLEQVPQAMKAATVATNLQCVVVQPQS